MKAELRRALLQTPPPGLHDDIEKGHPVVTLYAAGFQNHALLYNILFYVDEKLEVDSQVQKRDENSVIWSEYTGHHAMADAVPNDWIKHDLPSLVSRVLDIGIAEDKGNSDGL